MSPRAYIVLFNLLKFIKMHTAVHMQMHTQMQLSSRRKMRNHAEKIENKCILLPVQSLLPTAMINSAAIAAEITVTIVTGDDFVIGASVAETVVVVPAARLTCVE